MHLAVKECQLNKTVGNQKAGEKYPGKFEALIWGTGEKCAAKSIFLAIGVMEQVAVKESKLSLADTAPLFLDFGNGLVHTHCHYYLRVGLWGSTQSHLTRLYQSA